MSDVASVFEAIEEFNEAIIEARISGDPAWQAAVKGRRLVGPATQQRIRATLRSAISSYMKQRQGVLLANVASLIELPPGDRPRPLVWTGERVRAWQMPSRPASRTRGNTPAAGVSARSISGYPPPARRRSWSGPPRRPRSSSPAPPASACTPCGGWSPPAGLRCGEGCGLRRPDTDLDAAITTICWQITQLGWDTAQGPPKSDAGERQVALDAGTVADIRAWRTEQDQERQHAGDAWTDTGFEFTNPDGAPLHPGRRDRRLRADRLPRQAAPDPPA